MAEGWDHFPVLLLFLMTLLSMHYWAFVPSVLNVYVWLDVKFNDFGGITS